MTFDAAHACTLSCIKCVQEAKTSVHLDTTGQREAERKEEGREFTKKKHLSAVEPLGLTKVPIKISSATGLK